MVVANSMADHFGVHHKGHKACANEQLISTLSNLLLSLHLHLFHHNYYNYEDHGQFNPLVENLNLKCTCIEHAKKQWVKL